MGVVGTCLAVRVVRRLCALAAVSSLLAGLGAAGASAQATITINNLDGLDEGLNDPTSATPVGGNPGTTLGEQRLNAFQHAADLWAAVIDSPVEITIDAMFDDLPCTGGAAVLGQASPVSVTTNLSGTGDSAANPAWAYVAALANALAGEDVRPAEADVLASFNGLADPSCAAVTSWYYGLDGQAGDRTDLVEVALHEFAHGLGIAMLVLDDTGELLIAGKPDPLTAQAYDLTSEQYLSDMTDGERLVSLANVRQVVWDGPQVTQRAGVVLARGTPEITTTPPVAGFSGVVSDANFGAPPLSRSASGPLVRGSPITGVGAENGDVAGKVVLYRPTVRPDELAVEVEGLGAVAVLVAVPEAYDTPPAPIDLPDVADSDVPVLSITEADADALEAALTGGEVTINLSEDPDRLLGTDPDGRLLLNATVPVSSSTLSHWDMSARPNLLMEPIARPRAEAHGYGLALAWLQDLGWAPACGNGRVDFGEVCDDGAANDDAAADACRSDCRPARCGDRVVDTGEACDDGPDNRDDLRDACRTDCTLAVCGDGVVDTGETCDEGSRNSNAFPGACRRDCAPARCGDGVVDPGEACDDGDDNGDAPDACRDGCTQPRCGDGIRDSGEACDDGSATDVCSDQCTVRECSDGSRPDADGCADGGRAPAPCSGAACSPDAGVGAPGACADGGCEAGDGTANSPDGGAAEVSGRGDGCGCRLLPRKSTPGLGPVGVWLLLWAWRRRRR